MKWLSLVGIVVGLSAVPGASFASNCHKECVATNPFTGDCVQEINVCLPDRPEDVTGLPQQLQNIYADIARESSTACAQASLDVFGTTGACAIAVAAAIKTGGILWVGAGTACYADYRAAMAWGEACGSHAQIQIVNAPSYRSVVSSVWSVTYPFSNGTEQFQMTEVYTNNRDGTWTLDMYRQYPNGSWGSALASPVVYRETGNGDSFSFDLVEIPSGALVQLTPQGVKALGASGWVKRYGGVSAV